MSGQRDGKGTAKCPTCRGVSLKADNKVFPFCSVRCQLLDLGRWLDEEYRVPDQVDTSAGTPSGSDEEN